MRHPDKWRPSGKAIWRGAISLFARGDPNLAPTDDAFERAGIAKALDAGRGAGRSARVVDYLGGYNAHSDTE